MCIALTVGVILCIQNHFDRYWIWAEIVIKIAMSNDFWCVSMPGRYKYVTLQSTMWTNVLILTAIVVLNLCFNSKDLTKYYMNALVITVFR